MEAEERSDDILASPSSNLSSSRPRAQAPNNLPVPLTSFIGRKNEIVEVTRLLAETRLITLTGSGGCGKTRLGLEVAAGQQHRFAHGVWWVDLGSLTEAHLVAGTIADVLSIKELALQSFEERIRFTLQNKELLLVLDNCEHLIDVCARLVDYLLRRCPSLKVMTTSREPLGVDGETAWRVPSMSLPQDSSSLSVDELARYDAVRLFVERARKARPNFKITDDNANDVVDICRRLDGIPLAIELAAARARVLTAEQIAHGLSDRFRLLSGGSRTAVARQHTLLASVEWSYNLLSEKEAALLRRLAVFNGRFSLDAAEAVGADDAIPQTEVLDVLAGLVDKSLVQFEEHQAQPRYRVLETIRHYANQKAIECEEATAVRDRHLDFYADLAEAARRHLEGSGDLMAVLDPLDLDHDNFRTALEWALSANPVKGMRIARGLWAYWYARGYFTEGSERCEMAARATEEHPGWRARALATASVLATTAVDTVRARALAEEALALARAGDDDVVLLEALYAKAAAHFLTDPATSRGHAAEALELARALRDGFYEMRATYISGLAEGTAGNFPVAQQLLDDTLALQEQRNNRVGLHVVLFWRATTAQELGQLDDVEMFATRAVSAAREVHNVLIEGASLCVLADAATHRGDFDAAAARVEDVRSLLATHPDPLVEATWTYSNELLHYACGELRGAARSLEASRSFFALAGVTWLAAWACALQAEFARAREEFQTARDLVDRAIELARASGNPSSIGRALRAAGNLAYSTGQIDDAEDRLHEALRCFVDSDCKIEILTVLERLGEIACKKDRYQECLRLLGATSRIRESLGCRRFAPDAWGYAETLDNLRAHLDAAEFEGVREEGEAMTLGEAVAYATRGRGERKRPSSGWDSLTPVERDVVRHVAEGLTNPEIGKRLFISPGTVKNHLSHVFTKLDISTRAELAAEVIRREASEISG